MSPRPSRIVVGFAEPDHSAGPLAFAGREARLTGCPMHLVHAWHPEHVTVPEGDQVEFSQAWVQEALASQPGQRIATELVRQGLRASVEPIVGSPAEAVMSLLGPADLAVVGSSTHHTRWHPVAHHLLLHAPCPVAVVPDTWHPKEAGPRHVVLGYHHSARCREAMHWAVQECLRLGASLRILHAALPPDVWLASEADPPEGWADAPLDHDELVALAQSMGATTVEVDQVLPIDYGTAHALTDASRDAEALVLGNHRAGWLAAVTSLSVTEQAVLHPTCPVVAVPGSSDPPR